MEKISLQEELLRISKGDLDSAEALYKIGRYPQAMFSFQQSVEKLNKSFGLVTEKINANKLQNQIGHKPLKIHISLLKDNQRIFKTYKDFLSQNLIPENLLISSFELDKNLKEMKEIIKETEDLNKNPHNYLSVPEAELQNMINNLEQIMNKTRIFKKETFELDKDQTDKIKENIKEILLKISKTHVDYKLVYEEVNKISDEDITKFAITLYDFFNTLLPVYVSSLILAYLVQPHAALSRYPKHNFSPEDFYTLDLPLIKSLPKLIEIQKKSINHLEHFFKLELQSKINE